MLSLGLVGAGVGLKRRGLFGAGYSHVAHMQSGLWPLYRGKLFGVEDMLAAPICTHVVCGANNTMHSNRVHLCTHSECI